MEEQPSITQEQLVPGVCKLGLTLSGEEAQVLRRVVRRCRMALRAIDDDDPRPPFLHLILPLALHSRAVVHGLLALAETSSLRSHQDFYHHQLALSELRVDLVAGEHRTDLSHVHRLLASCLLLSTIAIGECDQSWVQHNRGMLGIVRHTNLAHLTSLPLGDYLVGMCAFQDISALSVGRTQLSQRAWSSYMSSRRRERSQHHFTSLEVTCGYPESLIDIIARAADLADDNAHMYLRRNPSQLSNHEEHSLSEVSYWPGHELELELSNWTPPTLPTTMSPFQALALRTAWETLRRACFMFVWRGAGFHSNLQQPLRPEIEPRKALYVDEMITNIQALVELGRTHRIPIGNSMMWPIAVMACECGASGVWQQSITALLDQMGRLYTMEHARNLNKAIQQLWTEQLQATRQYVSLESVCLEQGIILPLF